MQLCHVYTFLGEGGKEKQDANMIPYMEVCIFHIKQRTSYIMNKVDINNYSLSLPPPLSFPLPPPHKLRETAQQLYELL